MISGYEDGTFRPENNITREEFVKLVFEAFKNYAGFRPEDINVKRMAVYNEKMEKFRWFFENNTCNYILFMVL